ncbi:MAG: type II toxin-antitoxin system HicB family antitoxin [Proteobacteria bacterium]|nr:type II toxin-antitoxin system HicB family antitoxin [Pseudomonadota bacterium]
MKPLFPAKIEPDENGMFFVQFIDIEEAITEGETLEEALFNAQEVLTLTIESRLDEGMEIPAPHDPHQAKGKNIYFVAPVARVQAALLIYQTRGNRSMADLARALGTSWPAAKRLEDPHHSPTLKVLERAAATLGKRLILSFE